MQDRKLNKADVKAWAVEYVSSMLGIPLDAVSTSALFSDLGMDSADAVIMAGVMEEQFDIEVEPTIFLESPSIDDLVAVLAGKGVFES